MQALQVIISYLIMGIAIITTTTLFEFSKALISHLQGDATPKKEGRLTLNPLKHFEPVGFIIFLSTGYGWGKPVNTGTFGYKDRKLGTCLTYIIPTLLMAAVGVGVYYLYFSFELRLNSYVAVFLMQLGLMSIKLAVFNLLPAEPMAMGKIIKAFLNINNVLSYRQAEKIILLIICFGLFIGKLGPLLDVVVFAVLGFFGVV